MKIWQELYSIHSSNQQIVLRRYRNNSFSAAMQTFNSYGQLINETPMILDYEFFKNLNYIAGRERINGIWHFYSIGVGIE